ncbi:MAG TPA: hypothetical protein VGO00_27020 [Kofleriaceae bacterium]|nr:hypothetical protein [Kofleriaceae bacterium]
MKRIPKIVTRQVHDSDSDFGYLGELVVDGDRIFACGGTHGHSTMLVTNDGGASWDRRAAPATPGLRQMHVEPGALYVTGEYGMLAVSVDSALTWTKIPVDTTQCLFQLHRELDGTWWVVGDGGVVFRSTDGVTYTRVDSDWDTRLLGVVSLNNAVHIFGYDGAIRRWTGSTLEPLSFDGGRAITQILVTKAGTWIVIGDSALAFRSTDGGTSFLPIEVPTSDDLEAMIEVPQGIIVVGGDGTLLLSDDDGTSFERVPNEMTGHLWSIASAGESLFIGGDDGAIWQLAVSSTQTMMSEDKPDDDDDEEEEDEDDEDDDTVVPATFDSIEQASERWIGEGVAFSAALNDYVRRVYAVGPNKAGDEPEETRQDMAAYVREQLVALNESGEHRLARELFPPAYEPFDYEAVGQEITQLAYLADSRVIARIGDRSYFVERDQITAIDGDMLFFGQSADRRYVAKGYADRIAIHRGWDGPIERTLRHALAGVKSLSVVPDGDGAIAATEGGVYWLTERTKRLLLGDGDSVSYAHAAMSPNGRFVAMGTQDSPHLVLDRKTGRRYQFEPVSSYPHFAAFHHDRPEAILSSCHALYGSGSLAVNLDELIADGKEPARPINRTAWVYSIASTSTGYLLGDNNGYVWAIDFAGEQQWYCFLGSTLTALAISPDRKRLLVGSYAGYVIELDLAGDGDPRLLTNGPVKELGRWVFWRGHEPMIW